MVAPRCSSFFTRLFGALFETATIVFLSFAEKILDVGGVLARLSTTTRIGFLPFARRTVSRGLSEISVPIPTITASTSLLSLCKRFKSAWEDIRESPDLVAILPSKVMAAFKMTCGLW
jgi:hypothetical protein